MELIDKIRTQQHREQEKRGTRPGFYLVKGDARHFIAEHVNPAALERVADRVLSDRVGWGYWIDYSHGIDVHGKPAWSNLDHTDRFI